MVLVIRNQCWQLGNGMQTAISNVWVRGFVCPTSCLRGYAALKLHQVTSTIASQSQQSLLTQPQEVACRRNVKLPYVALSVWRNTNAVVSLVGNLRLLELKDRAGRSKASRIIFLGQTQSIDHFYIAVWTSWRTYYLHKLWAILRNHNSSFWDIKTCELCDSHMIF